MGLNDILMDLQTSGLAHLISKSNHLVAASLQIVHVLGFVLLLGALVLSSLRLMGSIFQTRPGPEVTRSAAPLFAVGLALTLLSGVLMFITAPLMYYYKWAFQLKMLLLALAIIVHLLWFRRLALADKPSPPAVRVTVAVSLLLWYGIALYGRLIGFT